VMKFAGYVVLATVLGYPSAVSQAAVVGIVCTDLENSPWHGDPLPADVWSFDYHTQTLTINEVLHDMCPSKDHPLGCFYDSAVRVWGWTTAPEQETLTIIKNITNETGITWTSYIQELDAGRSYCLFVEGSAESEKLPEITYKTQPPLPYTVEFAGPEPVSDGESVTIRFDVWCDYSPDAPGKFYFDVTPNPIPEPQTISLLALGALTLLRKQKRA